MFDLMSLAPVIDHLKNISKFFSDKGNEIIIHCPFCDDSSRPNASRHGHCYLSKTHPVFHCFRCSSSGTLLKLLVETDFQDEEIFEYLKQILSYKFIKNYKYRMKKKETSKTDEIYDMIINQNLLFAQTNKYKFDIYKQYLKERIGDVDYIKFLITPGFFQNKLTCNFHNRNSELVIQRLIETDKSNYRYHINRNSDGLYYFQEKDFEKFTRLVFTEGPFDMISLYLYNSIFKDSFFISINGKKYISVLEQFIIEDLLIGNYEVNFIFDADVLDYKRYLYRARMLIKNYNPDIELKGYKPLIQKDTADFPAVLEL